MFRKRPGRVRNVLCTFNLRPVSTGNSAYIMDSEKVLADLDDTSQKQLLIAMTQDVNWVYGVEVLCAKKSVQKFTEKDLVQARVTASANTD